MISEHEKVYEKLNKEIAIAVLNNGNHNHRFKCTVCGKTHTVNSKAWQKCYTAYQEKLFSKIFGFANKWEYYDSINISFKIPIINIQAAIQNKDELKQMVKDLFALFANISYEAQGIEICFSEDINLTYFFLPYINLDKTYEFFSPDIDLDKIYEYEYVFLTIPSDLFAEVQKDILLAAFNSSLDYVKSVIEKYSQILNKYCLLFDCNNNYQKIKNDQQETLNVFRVIMEKICRNIENNDSMAVIEGIKQEVYKSAYNYITPVQEFSIPRIPQQNFPDITVNCHEYRGGNQFIDTIISKAWEYLLPIREKMVDSFLVNM